MSQSGVAHAAGTGRVTARSPRGRLRAAITIGIGVALFVSLAFALDWFMVLELKTLDARFMARGERDDVAEVVVVGIDDASLRSMQLQWPWPRAVHAQLIDKLTAAGARAVAFDILFMEPGRDGPEDDQLLADAARRAGNVIFGQKLSRIVDHQFRTTALEQPLRLFTDSAHVALVNHQPDPDMFARRSYVAMRHQEQLHPTLSLAAVALYLGAEPAALAVQASGHILDRSAFAPSTAPTSSGSPVLDVDRFDTAPPELDSTPPGFDSTPPAFDVTPPGFDATPPDFDPRPPGLPGLDGTPPSSEGDRVVSTGAGDTDMTIPRVPLIEGGPFDGTYVINFRGGVRSVRTIPYYQVLQERVPREFLQDKIVFVGAATVDLEDHFATPFLPMGPMPGVEVHAHAALTLLRGDALQVPHPLATIVIIVLTAVVTSFVGGRLSAGTGFLAASGIVAALVVYALWTFDAHHVWFQVVPPVIGVGLSYTLINGYRFAVEERERRRVQNVFGRYVSQDVVEQLLASGDGVPLGGARQRVTVMFSDIRGFTSLSERLDAEAVVQLLNEYFAAMTGVIFGQGGMIDKFMGDAIMAVFGAPLPKEQDALGAVRAAIGMRRRLLELRAGWEKEGLPVLDSGIGINTAEVIVGNIGSHERMEYTVIGDGVNLAARLEELSKEYGGGILIGEDTYAAVRGDVVVQPLDAVTVRGKTAPVTIYKVLGLLDDEWRDVPYEGNVGE